MARAGEAVELAPRDVTIHRLDILEWDGSDAERPIAVIDVECSAGTYVRSLARDLGEAVGSAAYLGALVRTASGPFTLEGAVSLDAARDAAAAGPAELAGLLLPIDAGLDDMPELIVGPADAAALSRGQFVKVGAEVADVPTRIRDDSGRLIAIGAMRNGRLAPEKVLIDPPAPAAAND